MDLAVSEYVNRVSIPYLFTAALKNSERDKLFEVVADGLLAQADVRDDVVQCGLVLLEKEVDDLALASVQEFPDFFDPVEGFCATTITMTP